MAGTATIAWFGNTAVAGLTIVTSDFKSATGASTTHNLVTVPAGALLVVTSAAGSGTSSNATISSSPVITWTKEVDATYGVNSGDAEISWAVFAAGGSIDVTSNYGAQDQSSVCYVITGQEAVLGGAEAIDANESFPNLDILTTKANSIIIGVVGDWFAADGTSRVKRDASQVETGYHFTGNYTGYHFYRLAPTITTYTEGFTAPDMSTGGSTALLEIRPV